MKSFIAETRPSFETIRDQRGEKLRDMLYRRRSWRIVNEPVVIERDEQSGRAEEMT
jgi:hypothetical protein